VAINYPTALDTFNVPSLPQSTTLSGAGTSTRNHTQNHQDMGLAIMALQVNASPLAHDHSGTDGAGIWPTNKLKQVNTHQNADTDTAYAALHHTLGSGVYQAAPGNHAHDYTGPSIFNKPMMICTSTTRPPDPTLGQLIFETDTGCFRSWAQFQPNNVINLGITGTDNFARVSTANLNTTLWSQTYYTMDNNGNTLAAGGSPSGGILATPNIGYASWISGTNTGLRCIARRVNPADAVTNTDQQVLEMDGGNISLELNPGETSPSNDGFLRMSADGQSYVRFAVATWGIQIFYTTTGPLHEQFLGQVGGVPTLGTHENWTFKAIGRTFMVYLGGNFLGAVVDSANVTNLGSSYRGWGFGVSANFGGSIIGGQAFPGNIQKVSIADQPYYTSGLIWQLLPIGAMPNIRAEAHFRQVVVSGDIGGIVGFDTLIEDWFFNPFMQIDESQTDITIQETGHYDVHSSICWDALYNAFDQATVSITVNGLDIGRKVRSFMRGNGFNPGFSQTQEINFRYYFVQGDVLRVNARHNAPIPQWLYFFDGSPERQMCSVDVAFRGV
jgi:hypothetical protein